METFTQAWLHGCPQPISLCKAMKPSLWRWGVYCKPSSLWSACKPQHAFAPRSLPYCDRLLVLPSVLTRNHRFSWFGGSFQNVILCCAVPCTEPFLPTDVLKVTSFRFAALGVAFLQLYLGGYSFLKRVMRSLCKGKEWSFSYQFCGSVCTLTIHYLSVEYQIWRAHLRVYEQR